MACSVPDCANQPIARGWCNRHYKRWKRHGDPLGGSTSIGAAAEWLASHLANPPATDSCVIWPYGKGQWGYGAIKRDGGTCSVHIVVCEASHGPRPSGTEVAHSCGIRACVNAAHLRWATPAENSSDKLNHGTHNRGRQHYGAKLSAEEVLRIRASARTQRALADEYGVHPGTIQSIIGRRTWAWLD